jgi:outer membrane protein TolC
MRLRLTLLLSVLLCGPAAGEIVSLGAAMRLAGASNRDVLLAEQRLAEARARHESARLQFFPTLTPGFAVRGHSGRAQAVDGTIIEADKQSLSLGAAVTLQLELGEAYYNVLAARRLANAAQYSVEAQRQESVWQAVSGYLDLVQATASVEVERETLGIADNFYKQISAAASAGLAAKADENRAAAQAARSRVALRQAQESLRITAARLAQQLGLSPLINLTPKESSPSPVAATFSKSSAARLSDLALTHRPEIGMTDEQLAAALTASAAARYAPYIPAVRADVSGGGLGGGVRGDGFDRFSDTADYGISLTWRIGPGGLFDPSRRHLADARSEAIRIERDKLHDEIVRQVVEALEKSRSLSDQLIGARELLTAANATLKLQSDRKEFGIGTVLEHIEAQKDLATARLEYVRIVSGYNKAQFLLNRATGMKQEPSGNK